MASSCLCGDTEYVVLSCSGASDVGKLSDLTARKLSSERVRNMSCLALAAAADARELADWRQKNILVIDGCDVECGKRIMLRAQLPFIHARLDHYGHAKGSASVNAASVDALVRVFSAMH